MMDFYNNGLRLGKEGLYETCKEGDRYDGFYRRIDKWDINF